MLAKVYVRPEQINLIAVVHNGDLEHIMAMEVADVVSGCPALQKVTDIQSAGRTVASVLSCGLHRFTGARGGF
jgi:hypothetical protein